MKNITNEIKSYLLDKLNYYSGSTSYGCDLSHLLTESENATGSVYCNIFKTKELIKENFDLFRDFVQYYKDSTGELINPLLQPEICHVIFLIESCQSILSTCKLINDCWNDKIELTENFIEKLTEQINQFETLEF